LDRAHWSSASPVRSIFRDAFVGAGLPYFNPHSFRNTLVRLGEDLCKSPEAFKAWSQNLGHEKVLTTFLSYGAVACDRQGEILRGLATPQQAFNRVLMKLRTQYSKGFAILVWVCVSPDLVPGGGLVLPPLLNHRKLFISRCAKQVKSAETLILLGFAGAD
jgi:hypothetical protein